nr:unnamed protein product [Callosobruchus analis]
MMLSAALRPGYKLVFLVRNCSQINTLSSGRIEISLH